MTTTRHPRHRKNTQGTDHRIKHLEHRLHDLKTAGRIVTALAATIALAIGIAVGLAITTTLDRDTIWHDGYYAGYQHCAASNNRINPSTSSFIH